MLAHLFLIPGKKGQRFMKRVYLEHLFEGDAFYVTEEDYWNEIRPLVMKLRVCATCEQYFDPDASPPRPCVGLRICLQCFLQQYPGLQLLETKSVNEQDESTYTFVDQDGTVYTSTENRSDKPYQDISYNLRQNAFTLPERYQPPRAASEIALDVSAFQVYGDIQTASVLVAEYIDPTTKQSHLFLLYKNGGYKELPMRGEGRVLLERAEAMLQRTRQPDGSYLINGQKQLKILARDIYTVVSQMESAYYTLSMQYAPAGSEPFTEHEPVEKTSPVTLLRARERAKQSRQKRLQSRASHQRHSDDGEPTDESRNVSPEPMTPEAAGELRDPTRGIGTINAEEDSTE